MKSQKISVRGTVIDSTTKEILEDATVSIFRFTGPNNIARIPCRKGFVFSNLTAGGYLMVSTYEGYLPDSLLFFINHKDTSSLKFIIRLNSVISNLKEVTVHATIHPFVIRNDTIAFNSISFPSPPNSTLEILLSKLPGIQIDKQGNITINGDKVDKITIDGKDFFLNDLKTPIKNLTADMVSQVEVFDSHLEKLNPIGVGDDNSMKTINIKLKKNRKIGYTGNSYGGLGTNSGFTAGGTITQFSGSRLLLLNSYVNNINNRFTGENEDVDISNGIESVNHLGINYQDQWSSKLKVTIAGLRDYSNNMSNQELSRQTFLNDSSIIQNSASKTDLKNTTSSGDIKIQYTLDSTVHLYLRSTYTHQFSSSQVADSTSILTSKDGNTSLASIGKNGNNSANTINIIRNEFALSKQFKKPGRWFEMEAFQSASPQNQFSKLFSQIYTLDSTGNINSNSLSNQKVTQSNTNSITNLNIDFLEPVGLTHQLELNYSISQETGHIDKESLNYDSLTGKYDIPDTVATSRFGNQSLVQIFNAIFEKNRKKFKYRLGLTAQISQIANRSVFSNSAIQQNLINLLPIAQLHFLITKGRDLFIGYKTDITYPTFDQLQPIPNLTNPYLIIAGNPNLHPPYNHHFSGKYIAFRLKTLQSWFVKITGDFTQNQIASSSTVLPSGVQNLTYVNVKGAFHMSTYFSYSFLLPGQKNGIGTINLYGGFGHNASLVNGQENINAATSFGTLVQINFHASGRLFIDSKINIDKSISKYSLSISQQIQTLNANYNLKISWLFSRFLTLESSYNLKVTGSQNNIPAQYVSLWDAGAYKTFIKDKFEVHFSVFDILNSIKGFSQTNGLNYTEEQKTNLPGRLFLISLVWRFSKWNM